MRHVWLIIALAAGIVAALALAACGGDDSPEQPIVIPTEASTTGSLDQADFIEEADAICAEANAAIQEYADAGQGVTAAGEIADLRAGVVADIEELGPPADDRETLDEFLAALEAQVEAGEKIALALDRESDTLAFEEELTTAKSEAATAASAYGFEECGSETTASSTTGTGSADTSRRHGRASRTSYARPRRPRHLRRRRRRHGRRHRRHRRRRQPRRRRLP